MVIMSHNEYLVVWYGYVLPHMRILSHTRMGRPIRVWDIPYAYGPILCPIRVWASHMSMHA